MAATDLEKLVVQLEANIKSYERGLQNAMGVTNRRARDIENRWKQANGKLDSIGAGMARALVAPLAAVSGALAAREVLEYADAWTKAKNSLAVAGVVGSNQADVLERLYQSAQANAAPIGALAGLYGKAAQSADNLGASQSDLIKFSDGVAVALNVAGTGANEASGALMQLGQLLGAARVQAEEFNSVGEGARPILIAVANGLEAAGGSVNKLKELVNDGKVSGQQFFQAFLKGLPTIQAMAANSTQTIEQGVTKVTNAFTKYIGQTDESLGASQRLTQGLNALADNFSQTADVALQLAGILAGALVGRSLAGMIPKLAVATTAIMAFVAALRAGAVVGGVATAISGLAVAAGPVGLIIGAVATALYVFATRSKDATVGSRAYEAALAGLEGQATKTETAVAALTEAQRKQQGVEHAVKLQNALARELEGLIGLLDNVTMREIISPSQLAQMRQLSEDFQAGRTDAGQLHAALKALAQASGGGLAEILDPLIADLAKAVAGANALRGALRLMNAAEVDKRSGDPTQRDEANAPAVPLPPTKPDDIAYAYNTGEPLGGRKRRSSGSSLNELQSDIAMIRQRTAALREETAVQAGLNPLVDDYGFALEKTRAVQDLLNAAHQAGIAVTPQLRAQIEELAGAYAEASAGAARLAESQDQVRQAAVDFNATSRDVLGGFIRDMQAGASGAEALAGALQKVADKLLDVALNAAFPTGGGGIFSSLISSLFGGGGLGGGTSPAVSAASAFGSPIYASGGYTGDGGKYQPAGIVHRGEYVFSKEAVSKIGAEKLEALHRNLKGFAAGGFAGSLPGAISMPRLPSAAPAAAGSRSLTIAPNYSIDARGSQMNEKQLGVMLRKNNEDMVRQIKKAVPGWVVDHQMRYA